VFARALEQFLLAERYASLGQTNKAMATQNIVSSRLLKSVWFAAWGHAAYKISTQIGMPCRPGALTGPAFSTGSWRISSRKSAVDKRRISFQ